MSNDLISIPFDGDTIFAVERDETIWIVVKPICEGFGVSWKGQHQRLKDDPVLSEGIKTILIPSPGGMQETTCLKLELLNGWLFKIDPRRVKEEVRPRLIDYQRRCYPALFRHFNPTTARGSDEIRADPALLAIPSRFGDDLTTREKLSAIRETRLLHGIKAGRRMWAMLDFPHVADRIPAAGLLQNPEDGRACLEYLLGLDVAGRTVGEWLAEGADNPALNRVRLRVLGDGLFVANATQVFAGSRWAAGAHRVALIGMDGVHTVPNPLGQSRAEPRQRRHQPAAAEVRSADPRSCGVWRKVR